jgi:hypothetical protein
MLYEDRRAGDDGQAGRVSSRIALPCVKGAFEGGGLAEIDEPFLFIGACQQSEKGRMVRSARLPKNP